MNGMPFRTTAKRQIVTVTETNQVGEGVVLAVMKNTADVGHANLWNHRLAGISDADGTDAGHEQRKQDGEVRVILPKTGMC